LGELPPLKLTLCTCMVLGIKKIDINLVVSDVTSFCVIGAPK
jgi:hypothetical protein